MLSFFFNLKWEARKALRFLLEMEKNLAYFGDPYVWEILTCIHLSMNQHISGVFPLSETRVQFVRFWVFGRYIIHPHEMAKKNGWCCDDLRVANHWNITQPPPPRWWSRHASPFHAKRCHPSLKLRTSPVVELMLQNPGNKKQNKKTNLYVYNMYIFNYTYIIYIYIHII